MTRQVLTEATTQATATPVEGNPGRFLVQLISPGWGSSGYYSQEVLEAAAKAKVFGKGLHQYLDHPTATEQYDRPERTVRDLAAVLEEDARWDGDLRALVAEATVFGAHRQVLQEMADAIGVSIRASAEVEPGEAEGRAGLIITQLVEGISADYVTHAGRGGRILQVLESARDGIAGEIAEHRRTALAQLAEARNIGQWVESRLHLALTQIGDDMYGDGRLTREERIALSSAVGDGLDAFTATLEKAAPQLYQRDLWDDPAVIAAQVDEGRPITIRSLGDAEKFVSEYGPLMRKAIEAGAKFVPDHPAGQPTTQEETMPEIAESELRTLREAAGRVQTLESERDAAVQRAETAETERDELREANTARDRDATVTRILGEATEAAGAKLDEFQTAGIRGHAVIKDGTLDEAATRQAFDKALAKLAENAGQGRPRGLGGKVHSTGGEDQVSEADLDALDSAVFGEIKEA